MVALGSADQVRAHLSRHLDTGADHVVIQLLTEPGAGPAPGYRLIADAHTEDDAYGPQHPNTLTARHELDRWTGEAGTWPSPRDQFAALLPMRERVLGPEHPGTLTTRANLAHWRA